MNMPPFDTEAGSFEWSDSGKQLSTIFNSLIKHYGGNEKLASEIESEWAKSHIHGKLVFYTKEEVRWLKRNYMQFTYDQLAKRLGKTHHSVKQKLSGLYDEGLVKKRPVLHL